MATKSNLEIFRNIENIIRFNHLLGDLSTTVISLLFVYYVSYFSDNLNIKSIENYKNISVFRRRLEDLKSDEFNDEYFYEMLKVVESEYNYCAAGITGASNIYKKLRYALHDNSIVLILNEFNSLKTQEDIKEFIKYVFDKANLYETKGREESIYSTPIKTLGLKLLDVNSDDVMLDCNAGSGSLLTSLNKDVSYIGFSPNPESNLILKMVIIMLGFEHSVINNNFYFYASESYKANKIYIDNLLHVRLSNKEEELFFKYGTLDSTLILFRKAYDSLKVGGRAIITVPSRMLFSNSLRYQEIRDFISKDCLRAVVALPPLWNGISVNTNMILLEKGRPCNKVVFVDATNLGVKAKPHYSISESNIDKIIDSILEYKDVETFSKTVGYTEVLEAKTWVPSFFVSTKKNNDKRNIIQIEDELEKLYKELFSNELINEK